jgi:plastocyanin
MKSNRMLAIAALIVASPWSLAAEHLASQKDKSFSAKTLDIKVGDKVAFRNDDAFSHNIFSLTDAMPFDLGTYSGGQMKAVTFAKPGKFEIECAIHPDMHMVINVAP